MAPKRLAVRPLYARLKTTSARSLSARCAEMSSNLSEFRSGRIFSSRPAWHLNPRIWASRDDGTAGTGTYRYIGPHHFVVLVV
jgi:hypothetical protein